MISLEPKTKKTLQLAGKLLLAVIVLSALAWYLVINPYLIRQEKQRFESASVELEKLAQQIQTKIGPAQPVKSDNYCDRPNLKFAKGGLSCDVNIKLVYSNLSYSEAYSRALETSLISSEPLRVGSVSMNEPIFTDSDKRQVIFQDTESYGDLSCFIAYEYSDTTLIITLSCGGPVRAKLYPMSD